MKLLVIGASGLVGSKVIEQARGKYEVTALSHNQDLVLQGVHSGKIDIASPEEVESVVNEVKPQVIVNAAGMTDVDRCEAEPEAAMDLNARGPLNIAKAAEKAGTRVLHISTDYVFNGRKEKAYVEQDAPDPINVYGRTKLRGEAGVASACRNYLIARSSSVYGWPSTTRGGETTSVSRQLKFVPFVIDRLRAGKRVEALTDQYTTPTLADSLAEALLTLVQLTSVGLLNVAGRDCISRYHFAELIAETFELDRSLLVPVSSTNLRQKAPRPARSCLDCTKAKEIAGFEPVGAREGLELLRKQESVEGRRTK